LAGGQQDVAFFAGSQQLFLLISFRTVCVRHIP
jgi:hypothetical protein